MTETPHDEKSYTVNVPAAAGAENVTSCGIPAVSVNGDAGEELIPFGNPLTVMFTAPVNPFTVFSVIVTGALVPPTFVETDAGVTTMLKSATCGGGGGGCEELPHPFRKDRFPIKITSNRKCFKCLLKSGLSPTPHARFARTSSWVLRERDIDEPIAHAKQLRSDEA